MKQKKRLAILFLLSFSIVTLFLMPACKNKTLKKYAPTVESLNQHPVPEWFRDAKFGIFIHWGVYAVPAFHEWYIEYMSPRSNWMQSPAGPPYTAGQGDLTDSAFQAGIRNGANEYHRENFGVDFEYDDFIPMFKAENYDPDAWADLFKEAGAKYVVLTAKHGEEFALWPTKFTPRNAMDMGPKRDLAGDLLKSVRSKGMKMGFYHNTTYSFWDVRFPNQEWVEYMNNSIKELVDLYQPDILWGDVVIGSYRDENGKALGADHWNSLEVIAYFYNHSKNPDEVVTNDRWGLATSAAGEEVSKRSIHNSLWADYAGRWNAENGILLGDFQTPERRNITKVFDFPWETCDALDPASWGYNRRATEADYMTSNELVDYLCDIVSKGGNLLINIGPKADGTIPEVMQDRLRGVGKWLSENGEAIYNTRPWKIYGEGPTVKEIGSWGRHKAEYEFRAGDIRFTRNKNKLYVILLEWPGETITLNSLNGVNIKNITMIGSDEKIQWSSENGQLKINLPAEKVSPYASVLKLTCKGL